MKRGSAQQKIHMEKKLCIVMVGLPARGKTTIAAKLRQNLSRDAVKTRIFNNGELRRKMIRENTSYPRFFDPHNQEGVELREKIGRINIEIILPASFPEKYRAAVVQAAQLCTVKKHLENPPKFNLFTTIR